MKKLLSLLLGLLIVSSLFGSYLDETKTMDVTVFGALFDAIDYDNGHDEVMRFYWDNLVQYASPNPPSRYEGEDDWREYRASYDPINYAGTYATNSLIGALAVEIDDDDAEDYLNYARDYLLEDDPFISPHYLNLDSLWVEYENGTGSDCLSLGTTLINLCFITDMLWHYADSLELYNKLDEIAYYAYLILDTDYSYYVTPDTLLFNEIDYPISLITGPNNIRIRLAGALGYAGCILENADYINTAEDDLFSEQLTTQEGTKSGFIDLMTAENGTYMEGMLYTSFTMEGLTPFFTARNRLDLSNLPALDYGANVNL